MRYTIDPKTRSIDNNYSKLGVQGENKVEIVEFVAPKTVGQADLSGADVKCLLNATKPNGSTLLKVLPIIAEEENVLVTWEVGLEETEEIGYFKMALHFLTAFDNVMKTLPTTFEVMETINVESDQPILFSGGKARSANIPMFFAVTPELEPIRVLDNKLIVPAIYQNAVVQNDNEALTIPILISRMYKGEDLSLYPIRLHIRVADGSSEWIDFVPATQGEDLRLEWTLKRPHTSYEGKLQFQLEIGTETTDTFYRQTQIAEINISKTLDGDTPITPVSPSEFKEYLAQIESVKQEAVAAKDTAVNESEKSALSATLSKTSETNAKTSETNSLNSKNSAAASASSASVSERNSFLYSENSKVESDKAKQQAEIANDAADRAVKVAEFDPNDYYSMESGKELEQNKANYDAGIYTGTEIALQTAQETKAAVVVEGKTGQATSEQGVNLFDILNANLSAGTITSVSNEKITVIATKDKIVFGCQGQGLYPDSFTGQIPAEVFNAFWRVKPDTAYKFSFKTSTGSPKCFYQFFTIDKKPIKWIETSGNTVTFTVPKNVERIIANVNISGLTVNQEVTISEVFLQDIAFPEYEPFTPQSPSPDYPAPITGVGESRTVEVVSQGKNRLNFEMLKTASVVPMGSGTASFNADSVTIVPNTESCYLDTGVVSPGLTVSQSLRKFGFPVVSGKSYTFSCTVSASNLYRLYMSFADKNYKCILIKNADVTPVVSMIAPENAAYAFARVGLLPGNSSTAITFSKIQFEEGDKSTEFQPYRNETTKALVSSPLYSLPNGVHDTLDVETGKITRRVGKRIFNGTENNWIIPSWASNIGRLQFETTLPASHKGKNPASLLSSHFSGQNGGIPKLEIGQCGVSGEYFDVRLDINSSINTVNLWRSWLAANPVTVLYELATPTIEHITPALHPVFSGTSTIYCNDPLSPDLDVTVLDPRPVSAARSFDGYAAEIISGLEKRIAALESTINQTAAQNGATLLLINEHVESEYRKEIKSVGDL